MCGGGAGGWEEAYIEESALTWFIEHTTLVECAENAAMPGIMAQTPQEF
jgi:hypothetical protein